MQRPRFTTGEQVAKSEMCKVVARLLPEKKKPKILKTFGALTEFVPARVEHEVNRIRGYAFDSGEAGFSHSIIS